MGLHYMKFYTTDWRSDPRAQSLSMAARGFYFEVMAWLHSPETGGVLRPGRVNGLGVSRGESRGEIPSADARRFTASAVARLVRCDVRGVRSWIDDLVTVGLLEWTDDGSLTSPEVDRQASEYAALRAAGEKGKGHGAKGAAHGIKGGRPRIKAASAEPPAEPQKPPRGGLSTPAEKPPNSEYSSIPIGLRPMEYVPSHVEVFNPNAQREIFQPTPTMNAPSLATGPRGGARNRAKCRSSIAFDSIPGHWADRARQTLGEGWDLDGLFAGFRDHHLAKGTLSADWDASWRTWLARAPEWSSQYAPAGSSRAASGPRVGGESVEQIIGELTGRIPFAKRSRHDA